MLKEKQHYSFGLHCTVGFNSGWIETGKKEALNEGGGFGKIHVWYINKDQFSCKLSAIQKYFQVFNYCFFVHDLTITSTGNQGVWLRQGWQAQLQRVSQVSCKKMKFAPFRPFFIHISSKYSTLFKNFVSKLEAVFVYGPRLELIICPRLLFKTVKNIFGGTVALGCMSDMYYVLPCVFYCKINAVYSDYFTVFF